MTIDIQPGDTFKILPGGRVYQCRGTNRRWLSHDQWHARFPNESDAVEMPLDVAKAVITAAGHTVQEVQPPPAPVPCPTHAVINRDDGCIEYAGTHDQCVRKADGHRIYEVRPLAPAPLSPNMLKFIAAIEAHVRYTERDSGLKGSMTNIIMTTAQALLAEGGAK